MCPVTPHITLPESVRDTLIAMTKANTTKSKVMRRALILLELDKGKSYRDVAQMLHIAEETVGIFAKKYRTLIEQTQGQPTDEHLLSVLYEKARSGRPPKITGEQQAKITALACSEPPTGYAKWSLRLLADKAVELDFCEEISHTKVHHILKKTN